LRQNALGVPTPTRRCRRGTRSTASVRSASERYREFTQSCRFLHLSFISPREDRRRVALSPSQPPERETSGSPAARSSARHRGPWRVRAGEVEAFDAPPSWKAATQDSPGRPSVLGGTGADARDVPRDADGRGVLGRPSSGRSPSGATASHLACCTRIPGTWSPGAPNHSRQGCLETWDVRPSLAPARPGHPVQRTDVLIRRSGREGSWVTRSKSAVRRWC